MALTDKPVFVDVDPLNIAREMKTYFEALLSKQIQPAQIEQLLINGFAYRESVVRNQMNSGLVQNLVRFASFPVLDYLGEFVGVTRIPPVAASCQISLTFAGNTVQIVIPEGTRIAATDGRVFFRTIEAVTVPPDVTSKTVTAVCEVDGIDGNGYAAGDISVIQDPQPFLVSATNAGTTIGGAPEETDEQLRARIKLAPYQFSNAGSVGGYKFWTFTAHPSIVDVAVPKVPATPGIVKVYPLIDSGETTPTEILDAVMDVLTADKIRPTCDTPEVESPTRIEYTLSIQLILFTGAPQVETQQKVVDNAAAFILAKRRTLGQDVIREQLITSLMKGVEAEVYKINTPGFSDIIVNENSFAFCTGVNVIVTGTNNG
jgi:phage-related baseplate assembly protein